MALAQFPLCRVLVVFLDILDLKGDYIGDGQDIANFQVTEEIPMGVVALGYKLGKAAVVHVFHRLLLLWLLGNIPDPGEVFLFDRVFHITKFDAKLGVAQNLVPVVGVGVFHVAAVVVGHR